MESHLPTCFEKAPMGGVEMEIGVLFADVRGFTSLAEEMAPRGVAELMNRFYSCSERLCERLSEPPAAATSASLDLKGKAAPERVRIVDTRAAAV